MTNEEEMPIKHRWVGNGEIGEGETLPTLCGKKVHHERCRISYVHVTCEKCLEIHRQKIEAKADAEKEKG